jgi:hypothetical protein
MRSAVTAFTVTEVPVRLEPVTADPFIDALERDASEPAVPPPPDPRFEGLRLKA